MAHTIAGLGKVEDTSIGNHMPDSSTDAQRRDTRDSLLVLARIKAEGHAGEGTAVRVRNVSSGGLMADVSDEFRPGMRVEVALEGIGEMTGSVAWAEAGRIGIAFDHPIDKARARKPVADKKDELFRPNKQDYRRPGLKPDTRR